MRGQWRSHYSGSNSGQITIDIDDLGDRYAVAAYLMNDDPLLPWSAARFTTPNKAPDIHIDGIITHPVDHITGALISTEALLKQYPGIAFPTHATIDLRRHTWGLQIDWRTNLATWGNAIASPSEAGEPSRYLARATSWSAFKKWAAELPYRRYIFRGQSTPKRLRTTFHRTGRAHLSRFLNEDIRALHRNLSARTNHVFDLKDADENGAFFHLAQHHGYPTPLMDWTYSPFVAAFFAYRNIKNSEAKAASPDEMVRIFVFDQLSWQQDFNQIPKVTDVGPHVSVMEFIAIENERTVPQQAVSMVTNVDDVETYIHTLEQKREQSYLTMIEIPRNERAEVMRELSTMGITAGSLFPSLDGMCEELRERYFDI